MGMNLIRKVRLRRKKGLITLLILISLLAAPLAPQTEGSAAANPFLADQLQQQILLDAALAASLQRQQQVQHLQADVFGAVSSGSAQQVAAAHSITGNPASLSAVAANTGSCASNQAASLVLQFILKFLLVHVPHRG